MLATRQASLDVADAGLFSPVRLGPITLPNRLAVAPMTRVSATETGVPTPRMGSYYATFAVGGFGLVITEGIYTDTAYSQGYQFQPGLTSPSQRDAWRAVVDGVHGEGGRVVAQLMHAGALSQGNRFRRGTRGPSAIIPRGEQLGFYRGAGAYPLPGAISCKEIQEVLDGFSASAAMAREAGFDGVEVHGANGYLLDQFLTDYTNQRLDGYGVDLPGRMRLMLEVIQAVRSSVGPDFLLGVRISQGKVNDFYHKWAGGEDDAAYVFGSLGEQAIDYIHTTEFEAWRPAFDGGAATLAGLARKHGRVPVMANGSLHAPGQAASLIVRGDADLVSLGRGALANPDWPGRLASGRASEPFDPAMLTPIADLANADRHRRSGQG